MIRIAVLLSLLAAPALAKEYLTGKQWQEPTIITPGETCGAAPSDAVVLFGGEDLSAWNGAERWSVKDGDMVVGKGKIYTKQEFGDCQLHIEWSAPTPPKGKSQGRGNSGVFFVSPPGKNGFEMQVLDSYDNKTYFDGQAASIYKQTPPMANAMRPPGEWNVYDIAWTAPTFDDAGKLKSPAAITALHNGVLVLNHFELLGDTPFDRPPTYEGYTSRGPIGLQDHGNPIRFRNIWVREIKAPVGEQVREPWLR
ncbi:hypothetical protein Pla175_51350 [Pirellulimonas nuda]|uniref:3-keto-alpha-glucoside-1,2-lyase/3-keto-2-hydroxy-glucal hydratase domain-containing protein n=1 Tax=Pirellulimonas nuda TaxID=2528009 RepID=A0A518DJQ4_9BACT|nr:DUF1080 domain-containing protein [Pirellulimonas nuda]QDU91705.1 hypothetical protein Pla175_51350 [Pirellulimonas nuda]